jgi:hypothetical protein
MSWISFSVFDLGAAVTGGALENIGTGLNNSLPLLIPGPVGQALPVLLGGLLGLIIILMFPMHWFLFYRPDQWTYALAVMIPWVLACFVTSYLMSHSPRGGINTSFAIGIFYMITFGGVMTVLSSNDTLGPFVQGAFVGLTDLNPTIAVILSCLEGSAIGAVFGALAGSLKYNPKAEDIKGKGKSSKKSEKKFESFGGPSLEENVVAPAKGSGGTKICPNCSAKVDASDVFCMNCGTSFK